MLFSGLTSGKGFRLALQAIGVLAIVFAVLHWQFGGLQDGLSQRHREGLPVPEGVAEQDRSAKNSTLGVCLSLPCLSSTC